MCVNHVQNDLDNGFTRNFSSKRWLFCSTEKRWVNQWLCIHVHLLSRQSKVFLAKKTLQNTLNSSTKFLMSKLDQGQTEENKRRSCPQEQKLLFRFLFSFWILLKQNKKQNSSYTILATKKKAKLVATLPERNKGVWKIRKWTK